MEYIKYWERPYVDILNDIENIKRNNLQLETTSAQNYLTYRRSDHFLNIIKEINENISIQKHSCRIDDVMKCQLYFLFQIFEHNYDQFRGKRMASFISYNFLLYRLIYLLDPYSPVLPLIPQLKSKEKINRLYRIWNRATEYLGWPSQDQCFEDQKNEKESMLNKLPFSSSLEE